MWPLQRSYCLENVRILSLSILGFHQNLSKILVFISQSPPFHENPISSVRPSETQNSRFLCVHPHSGGVVGFSIIGFSSMTPSPRVTAAATATARSRRSLLQGPGPVHHSHPGPNISRSGSLTPILILSVLGFRQKLPFVLVCFTFLLFNTFSMFPKDVEGFW